MYRIIKAVDKALQEGKLRQPFNAHDFKVACPGFAENTYRRFLPKHCVGNPDKNTEYFERVKRGVYKRISNGV